MNLCDVLTALGIPEAQEVYEPHWEETQARMPSGPLPHLTEERVLDNAQWTGLDAEVHPMLLETARRIQANETLRRLWWHCHCLIYDYETDYPNPQCAKWPTLEKSLGDTLHPLFHLLLSSACVPMTLTLHRAHGVPEEITRSTCADVNYKVLEYRMFHNRQWGTMRRSLYWFRHHAAGRLFAVGRFQYMVRAANRGVRAYRNLRTGVTIALAGDGARFTPDGLIHREGDPKPLAWTARLVYQADGVRGCPIAPTGRAENREVFLPTAEWRCVLEETTPMLDMHIPAGGGMTLEVSKRSFEEGMAFFARYFPGRPFRGIMCGSWIFSPQLEEFLKPEANLVVLEKEVYLFPIPSTPVGGLVFVFGQETIDPATAPRETSLQRAILDQMARGGEMRLGGMFVMAEDVKHIGARHYLANYPPAGI